MATFGLMNFKQVLSSSVNGKAAIAGAAAGTFGIGAVNFGLNTIKVGGLPLSSKIPAGLTKFLPLISAALAGALGWFALKKAQPKYANSFAIGSLSAGTVLTVAGFLQGTKIPAMSDLVTYRLPGMGYVVPTPPMLPRGLGDLGMVVPDTGSHRMNGLAASAMGDTNEYVEYNNVG